MAPQKFQCPRCEETFETEDELNQHTERAHPMSPVPGEQDFEGSGDPAEDRSMRADSDSPERGGNEQRL